MNPRALFLVASLVANIAFAAAFVLRPTLAPPSVRDFFQTRAAREAASAATEAKAQRTRTKAAEASARAAMLSQTKLWSALQSDDLRTLIARLRAAGFPPGVIRAVVGREVDNRFAERIKALNRQVEETPYWQQASLSSFNNPKFFEERQQAYRDRAKMMRELLGDQAFASAGMDPTALQRLQFGDLSKEKVELVQRINDDYAEMLSQVRAATNGIVLPEDRAKLALLEREKHADLAGILTPQELEDYEMRSSQITSRLRGALTLIDATEDEFRTIYRINLPYADVLYPSSLGGMISFTADMRQKRDDATRDIQAQLKTALGDARTAELNRAQNYEFQTLARLAQRDNLPMAAAVKAYDLRASTTEASARIGDNNALSVDQKIAGLRDLAQNTKTQLSTLLGANAANAYVQSATWLQAIEKGNVVTFSPDGMGTSFRQVSTPRPATPPPPPPR
jgi:hypothetical protein